MSGKKNKNKNKTSGNFFKVYVLSCVIGLLIGAVSFFGINSVSQSVMEINKNIVKIPSYESVMNENGKNENKTLVNEDENEKEIVLKEKTKPAERKTESEKKTVAKIEDEKKVPIGEENVAEEAKIEKVEGEVEGNADIAQNEENVKAINATVDDGVKVLTFTKPCKGKVIKPFSPDKPLKSKTLGDFRVHMGIDIKSTVGDSVFAVCDGVVEKVYDDSSFGVTVIIGHSEKLKTQYSNLAGDDMVKKGMEVKKGQAIGCVGDTAKAELLDEAHLHFAVLENDKYVNPDLYMEKED